MEVHDHRSLGAKLDLFHQQEDAPGTAFWRSRGTTICLLLESYIRCEMQRAGFLEDRTPQLMSRSLWERSGHWSRFSDNMFAFEDSNREYALKPMNCPGHVQLFRQQIRSYRDLPLRFNEFGVCHRYEPSGSLHGLKRVRAFTQDDAHVFCMPEHINAEVSRFYRLLQRVYRRLGFADFKAGLSTRPDNREGSDEIWDKSEDPASSRLELGSITVVVATDAPLLPHQLKRVAQRVALRLGRLGSSASDSSGDIFIAFSTANKVAFDETPALVRTLPNPYLTPVFVATVEATEEAVVNAMIAAEKMIGADRYRVPRLPHDELVRVLTKHGVVPE